MKAQTMVDKLEQFLSSNIGVDTINVDGQQVRFNRSQAMKELNYWKSVAAKEQHKRSLFRGFNLGTAW